MQPLLRPRSNLTAASWLWLFGRLRPGVDRSAARAELSALADARFVESGQADYAASDPAVTGDADDRIPGRREGPLLGFFGVLLGAAALVLLIAGVNVAAMLSARYTARRREMAVRAALGAGRGRLLRQLLTEILTLFALGAGGGFLVATRRYRGARADAAARQSADFAGAVAGLARVRVRARRVAARRPRVRARAGAAASRGAT